MITANAPYSLTQNQQNTLFSTALKMLKIVGTRGKKRENGPAWYFYIKSILPCLILDGLTRQAIVHKLKKEPRTQSSNSK